MTELVEITQLQRQIVDLREKFTENPDHDNVRKLFETLFELLHKQRKCKLYEDAIKTYEEIIDLLIHEDCFNTKGSYWCGHTLPIHYLGEAFYYYTEVLIDQENFEEASENVGKALDIRKQLYDDCSYALKPIYGRLLGNSYRQVARIAESIENMDVMWEYLALYQEMYESNASLTNAERERRFLAECYEEIGKTAERSEEYTKADEYYLKELQEYKDLANDFDLPELSMLVGRSYQNLGISSEIQAQLFLAKDYYEKSITYIEEGIGREEYGETPLFSRESLNFSCEKLANCYEQLGDLAWNKNEFEEARGYYEKSVSVRERLLPEDKSNETLQALGRGYIGLADLNWGLGNKALSLEFRKKNISVSEEYFELSPTPEVRLFLDESYIQMAIALSGMDDNKAAAEYIEKAFSSCEKLAADLNSGFAIRNLACACIVYGIICMETGEKDKAKDLMERGLKESKAVKNDSFLDWMVTYVKTEASDIIDTSFIDA